MTSVFLFWYWDVLLWLWCTGSLNDSFWSFVGDGGLVTCSGEGGHIEHHLCLAVVHFISVMFRLEKRCCCCFWSSSLTSCYLLRILSCIIQVFLIACYRLISDHFVDNHMTWWRLQSYGALNCVPLLFVWNALVNCINGYHWKKVDKFFYLGDILDADGGCDWAVTARVRSAWKKFREYLPILTGKGFSLKLKGKVLPKEELCVMYECTNLT